MRVKLTTLSSQAVERLVALFPESEGNLDADDVLDAVEGHNHGRMHLSMVEQEINMAMNTLVANNSAEFHIR